MSQPRRTPLLGLAPAAAHGLSLAACGDTGQGLKKHTKDNRAAAGRGVECGGERIQDAVE